MNIESIKNQFDRMGARFRVSRQPVLRWLTNRPEYSLAIAGDRQGQIFEFRLNEDRKAEFDLNVLQCERHDRHLLLLVKTPNAKDRFLCGHDEREWFVAAVPGGASSVLAAKLALLPTAAKTAADGCGLNTRQRTRRHNRAFLRQGEWFFVPVPSLVVDGKLILRDEPINRGRGKSHYIAEVYRSGGDQVWVCEKFPNGVLDAQYRTLLARNVKAKAWGWQSRIRDARVYARGAVSHLDHATITLHGWNEVWMNTENTTRQMANVAFLD